MRSSWADGNLHSFNKSLKQVDFFFIFSPLILLWKYLIVTLVLSKVFILNINPSLTAVTFWNVLTTEHCLKTDLKFTSSFEQPDSQITLDMGNRFPSLLSIEGWHIQLPLMKSLLLRNTCKNRRKNYLFKVQWFLFIYVIFFIKMMCFKDWIFNCLTW